MRRAGRLPDGVVSEREYPSLRTAYHHGSQIVASVMVGMRTDLFERLFSVRVDLIQIDAPEVFLQRALGIGIVPDNDVERSKLVEVE